MRELLHDLASEHEVLDHVLNHLKDENWDVPSPAEGWTLRDCVSHLAELDELAVVVVNERSFPERSENPAGGALTMVQLEAYGKSPTEMVSWWRESAQDLIEALSPLDPSERLPWFGPPMSARSFASGRLLEAWSHGLDILDAAGVEPQDTDRIKNIAHMGYTTREFAYVNRGLAPPTTPLYVELLAPSGTTWTWGDPDSPDRITGPAGDFCRIVTQRIHPSDTELRTEGSLAAEYLEVAQAFAGPPGPGRPPGGPNQNYDDHAP